MRFQILTSNKQALSFELSIFVCEDIGFQSYAKSPTNQVCQLFFVGPIDS
jgi:hypothetical protein